MTSNQIPIVAHPVLNPPVNQIPIVAHPVLNPPVNLVPPLSIIIPISSNLQIPKKIAIPKLVVNLEKPSPKTANVKSYLKIENVLKYGNIYAALKSEYLSGAEVMEWLRFAIKRTPKAKLILMPQHFMEPESLMLVYRAICLHAPEEIQLDNKGKHFLSNTVVDMMSYQQVYILTHLSRDFYGDLDSILGVEAIKILKGKHSSLAANCVSFPGSGKISLTQYPLIFFTNHRIIPKGEIIEKEIILNCIKRAIDAEYFEWIHKHILHHAMKLKSVKKILLAKIVRRSTEIRKTVPDYWDRVVKKGFISILAKLNLDLSQKASIYQLYPELCPELAELSPLSLKIMNLKSSFLRGYLLGFPIERYLPKETELLKAASNLSKLGGWGYGVFLRHHNQRKIKHICRNPELPSGWHIPDNISDDLSPDDFNQICLKAINLDRIKESPLNDVNLSKVDKISDFSPFDRIFVQSGNGFHFFTRSSFGFLLKSKKNPYNNQPLDPGTLVLLKDRVNRAKLMKLPECKTLIELLELLKSNKLTVPYNDQQITSPRHNRLMRDTISLQDLAPIYYTSSPAILGSLMDAMGI